MQSVRRNEFQIQSLRTTCERLFARHGIFGFVTASVTLLASVSSFAKAAAGEQAVHLSSQSSCVSSFSTTGPHDSNAANRSVAIFLNDRGLTERLNSNRSFDAELSVYRMVATDGSSARFIQPVHTSVVQTLSRNKRPFAGAQISARLHIPMIAAPDASRAQVANDLMTHGRSTDLYHFAQNSESQLWVPVLIRDHNARLIRHEVHEATTIAATPVAGVFLVGSRSGQLTVVSADPTVAPFSFPTLSLIPRSQPTSSDGLTVPLFADIGDLQQFSFSRSVNEQVATERINSRFRAGEIVHIRFLPREVQGRRPLIEIGRRNFRNYANAGPRGFELQTFELDEGHWKALVVAQPKFLKRV